MMGKVRTNVESGLAESSEFFVWAVERAELDGTERKHILLPVTTIQVPIRDPFACNNDLR